MRKHLMVAKAIRELKVACLVDKSNYQGTVIDPIILLEILTEDIAKELNLFDKIEFKKGVKIN